MAAERLIVTGFMAVGKSTIVPIASHELGTAEYDTDRWVEKSGIDIPSLVRTDMPTFRKLEAKALQEILDQEPGIVSTGGGIVSTQIGRKALLASGVPVVWLQAPFDVLAERVKHDEGIERPLFDNSEKARQLYMERYWWYGTTADYTLDANRPAELVAEDLVNILRAA